MATRGPPRGVIGGNSRQQTTKIRPRSFALLHFSVYWSFLYAGFLAADASSVTLAPGSTFSSIKTSRMRALITLALTGAYDLDQSTTPDVVRISKLSSISAVQTGRCRRKTRGVLKLSPHARCLGRAEAAVGECRQVHLHLNRNIEEPPALRILNPSALVTAL